MTKKEVEDYREELDEIHVRGRSIPKPIKNWSQCGVDIKVMNVLKVYVFYFFNLKFYN
jgi:ATP-dependent RNA helicase DDX46/PRP5